MHACLKQFACLIEVATKTGFTVVPMAIAKGYVITPRQAYLHSAYNSVCMTSNRST